MKERMGLGRKAAERMAETAYFEGVDGEKTTGQLRKYISLLETVNIEKGTHHKLYGEMVYCFYDYRNRKKNVSTGILITVFWVPANLKNQVLGIQKRKNRDSNSLNAE